MVHTQHDPQQDAQQDSQIDELLATLERIPRAELPDGEARRALAALIRAGDVDNLYRPLGADYHNIAWTHVASHQDPRQRVRDWLEAWHAVQRALEQLAAHMRMASRGGEA